VIELVIIVDGCQLVFLELAFYKGNDHNNKIIALVCLIGGLYFQSEYFGPLNLVIKKEKIELIKYAAAQGGQFPPANTKLQ
jgi:hypothetical protein